MILVNSSVWIDYLKGVTNQQTDLLDEYLILGGTDIYTCPIIVKEVLQGIREDIKFVEFKQLFLKIQLLSLKEPEASIQSAE